MQDVGVRVREAERHVLQGAARRGRRPARAVPSMMVFSASKISAIRSAAVIASWDIDSRNPERRHGPDQRHHQRREGDEGAERDLVLTGRQRAEAEDDDQGDAGDDAEEGQERRLDPDPGERSVVQPYAARVSKVAKMWSSAAERLDGPDAVRRLLHGRGDVAGLVLDRARETGIGLLGAQSRPRSPARWR